MVFDDKITMIIMIMLITATANDTTNDIDVYR